MDRDFLLEIQEIVPKPELAGGRGSLESWMALSTSDHLVFPSDYMQFIDCYGGATGWFEEITIDSPFDPRPKRRLMHSHTQWAQRYRQKRAFFDVGLPEYHPLNLVRACWPEPEGLLAFGGDGNTNTFFWRTVGHPDEWKVEVFDHAYSGHEVFDMSITEFLFSWLSGNLETNLIYHISALRDNQPLQLVRHPV